MPVPIKKSSKQSGVSSVHGHCQDCTEKWEGGQTAFLAIKHHDATGHSVHVEQTIWWERHSTGNLPPKKPPRQ